MKELTNIRLINWHLFENVTIPCRGSTYFIGVNGVGKSTILDAVQFALVGGQRDVRFNRAAMHGSRRTLAGYVRGELGNEARRFLRGDTTGVVALEFRNPDDTFFVHGAVIDAYEDNRAPDITYFIVNNAALNDAWFFKAEGTLFNSREFRRHMEHFALPSGAAQLFSRLEDYRFHLLNRLGQLQESFPSKIVKGLAFSPLTNIREFVHSYLLDENLVDVDNLRQQLETMRHFESLAADVRERIAALDKIEEIDRERATRRRLRLTNGYIFRRADSDVQLAALKLARQTLDEKKVALTRLELRRDEAHEQLQFARQALLDAQVALATDTTAAREKSLREEIAQLGAEVSALQKMAERVKTMLAQEHRDARQLRDFLRADGLDVPSELEAFIAATAADDIAPDLLFPDLQSISDQYAARMALIENESRELRAEAARLQQEINKLRTGDRAVSYQSEAPQSAELRQLLRAELNLSAEQVQPLFETLHIPDESWQDAVEGILGRARFDLLVPPEYYDAAMKLYRRYRIERKLHGVGLPDTERIARYLASRPRGTGAGLAAEVQTDHPAARALVDLLLGGMVKCDSTDELRHHRTAVTRECFVRRNFTTRHLNPRFYRRWFIGERAAVRQIEQREERLNAIARELTDRQTKTDALKARLALTRDKMRRHFELSRDLPQLTHLPELTAELAEARRALAALDTQTVDSLKGAVAMHESAVQRHQAALDALGEEIGGLKNALHMLETETIPALEKRAAELLQEAKAFLAWEDAADLEEAAETEYERRRKRQPLETIRDNAENQMRKYQSGEARSRDKLRDAKKEYSLKYQFGYDNDEDAARYLREREKYVESTLPEYEERIATLRQQAEQELVENFIHRLREQIEDAKQQLAYLNATLSKLRFGGEQFKFITKPEPSLRQVYDMIMDSQYVLGESLFESDFRQKYQQGWDLLFERLTAAYDEAQSELRELQDYRNYLQYDIRIHYPNGDSALLSQINAKKSGGETTTPFYVAMAASFAQAYRLNQPRPADTIRLALFDEAFGKMDAARTASSLKFMVDNQLQVLLATPPDKAASLLPYVDSVRTVVREDNHAFVIEIDKTDMLARLEA